MTALRAGFYGDDFTGSVDALLQFARAGWSGRLFVGTPAPAALADAAREVDVVGVAGIARSLATDDLETEVRPALEALRDAGAPFVQYKASSTADSSPEIGSLGRVIEIGRAVFGDRVVPMLFAQPDFGRHTVFGHHFAAEGGVIHRLDRQPTMSQHPSTPMSESDLVVHVGRQTDLAVVGVAFPAYAEGSEAVAARLRATDAAAVLLDAADEAQLMSAGAVVRALEPPVFAIGSGGLSTAVAGRGGAALPTATPARGPVLAVSGSRSRRTREQADAAAAAKWIVEPLVLDGSRTGDVVAALAAGRSVALTSDDARLDAEAGDAVLEQIAAAAASIVDAAVRAGTTHRVIVCGGDTSSRVTRLLGVESLSIAANPEGNVVVCRAHAADPTIDGTELLLKGGQVGGHDLFEQIRTLGS